MTKDGSYALISADIRVPMYTAKQNWNDEKPNKRKRKKNPNNHNSDIFASQRTSRPILFLTKGMLAKHFGRRLVWWKVYEICSAFKGKCHSSAFQTISVRSVIISKLSITVAVY